MNITPKQIKGAKPEVISMLDGKAPVGKAAITSWPAIKFPGSKKPVLLIEEDQDEPRPAKSHDAAMKIATKIVAKLQKKPK